MSGDANLTVRTLAAAAEALGADVEIRFSPRPKTADSSLSTSPVRDSGITSRL
jgi:hypothetical protein